MNLSGLDLLFMKYEHVYFGDITGDNSKLLNQVISDLQQDLSLLKKRLDEFLNCVLQRCSLKVSNEQDRMIITKFVDDFSSNDTIKLSPASIIAVENCLSRNSDTALLTAYIESLQKEIRDLKARLNYIQNGNGEMFIPPKGESLD